MRKRVTIFSRQFDRPLNRGPAKVLKYTIDGLRALNCCPTVNEYSAIKNSIIWVQDDMLAAIYLHLRRIPTLVGPNLVTLPSELPRVLRNGRSSLTHIVPCSWVRDLWIVSGGADLSIKIWPVGIGTCRSVEDKPKRDPNKVLVYFKSRDGQLVDQVLKVLESVHYEVSLITYGDYQQDQLVAAAVECSFGIWIAGTETQNIALMEVLAYGLPLIVLDALSLGENVIRSPKIFPQLRVSPELSAVRTTSAPYFDNRCGVKIERVCDLKAAIQTLAGNLSGFDPAGFIEERHNVVISIESLFCNQAVASGYSKATSHFFYLNIARLIWLIYILNSSKTYRFLFWRIGNALKYGKQAPTNFRGDE